MARSKLLSVQNLVLWTIWLFPLAVSLHNLEEGLGFSRYAVRFKAWQHVGVRAFRFALVVLAVLAFVTALLAQFGGPRSVGAYLHVGYMLAMLLNVFVPHLAASLARVSPARGRLMPGTVTALLLILPVTLTGIITGLRSGWLEPLPFALYGVGVIAALLASLPLLFKLGARVFNTKPRDTNPRG